MRRALRVLVIGVAALVISPVAFASGQAPEPIPEPIPVPPLPPIDTAAGADSSPLIPVPAGCPEQVTEQAVFVGSLIIADAVTGRFRVEQVKSGSVEGFAVVGMIDVYYGDEVRFLDVDQRYIVGAAVDPELRRLASTVREPAPLFGGNEIAGLDDADVECPSVESPVRTLSADTTSVESGVLTPLKDAKGKILRAILEPVGAALVILLGLVALKHLLFALGRSLRSLGGAAPDRS
jgi:hypothetical protein